MQILSKQLYFPPVETADRYGVLAVGGDLSLARLLLAYRSGIFPWYNPDEPIIWHAPNFRMVLPVATYKPKKSLRNLLNRQTFTVTYNQCFEQVVRACKEIERKDQDGTWISDDIIEAYTNLYKHGHALSVEVWQDNQLVGGLYGVRLNKIFCGESMFSRVSNASKIAFHYLIQWLKTHEYVLVDGQVHNHYLEQLGFFEIERKDFMMLLDFYE